MADKNGNEEQIFNTRYWRERIDNVGKVLPFCWEHTAVYVTTPSRWKAIEDQHKKILQEKIGSTDNVLDAGCGYGRLVDMMPKGWAGMYVGIDFSPDFVLLANQKHPERLFKRMDMRDFGRQKRILKNFNFRWAVCISIRKMVIDNEGTEAWEKIAAELKSVAQSILILEYDENDKGEIL